MTSAQAAKSSENTAQAAKRRKKAAHGASRGIAADRRKKKKSIITGMERANSNDNPVSDDIDEAMSQALETVRKLAVSIRDATVSDEHIWFRNLLLGILNSALLDFRYVEIGTKQKSPYLAAWSCRNLLELKVIAKYALTSINNAIDFKNDFVIDSKEFYEALSKRQKATHSKLCSEMSEFIEQFEGNLKEALKEATQREVEHGPQTTATDAEAEMFKQLIAEFGIKEKTIPKRSGEIAKLVNQSEEFAPMFKVCSKIMHRTALSIASSVVLAARGASLDSGTKKIV
jgi:hypothetical protein